MIDESPFDEIRSLPFLVDQATEAIRRANHHTHILGEVTDLPPVLGALSVLFSRLEQLTGYLEQTVAHADATALRHDRGAEVNTTLDTSTELLTRACLRTAETASALNAAWAHLSHLAPTPGELVCPECGEPAFRGIPIDLTPSQRAAPVRPRWRHADGTQLCPVIGEHGYEPATPVRPDPTHSSCTTNTGSISTGSTSTDPQQFTF